MRTVPRRPVWGLRPTFLVDPALSLDRDRAFLAAASSTQPLSHSAGARRTQSALGGGLEGWRGPYPGLPPPPIHLGVKLILFPHVWGLRRLPLQDHFLLQFVFQLETLGAPRQGGGSSAVARGASKDPKWNASWGDCWPGRRGSRCGAPDGIPHSFSSPPEGLYVGAEGLQRSGMGTPCHPFPRGWEEGRKCPPS